MVAFWLEIEMLSGFNAPVLSEALPPPLPQAVSKSAAKIDRAKLTKENLRSMLESHCVLHLKIIIGAKLSVTRAVYFNIKEVCCWV